jgi:hypothetical protein
MAMPTVLKYRDIAVIIRIRDEHPPAHVHVESSKYSVRIDISGTDPIIVKRGKKRRITTTAASDQRALQLVAENLELCKQTWRNVHGEI